jgi:HTH-type transcriptional regulator / antitoxin HipB
MVTFTPHRLGQIIKAYRLEQKLTQAQLAAKSGTGLRFIVELERGKPTVQLGKVIAVADALGLMLMLQKDVSAVAAKAAETIQQRVGINDRSIAESVSNYKTGPSYAVQSVVGLTKSSNPLQELAKQFADANAKPPPEMQKIQKALSGTVALDRYLQSDELREYIEMQVRDAKLKIIAKK